MMDKHIGVRLLEQDVRVYEKTPERLSVKIDEKQFVFPSGRCNFVLRQLQEKFGAKKKELFLVFVDLERNFNRVPREAI